MPRSKTDYTVACVCPMGIELAPVVAMLDREHERLPVRRDQNAYTLGEIGRHNVVVAVMPETGTNAAAMVITQLLSDFSSIRFGLLVGIAGGVPGRLDVRLGDVVVSQPSNEFGGVVQYDLGKKVQPGSTSFERTGLLNKPPPVLSANVRQLHAQHLRQGSQMKAHLSEMLQRYPQMEALYVPPNVVTDQLFHSSYIHQSGSTCDQCDQRQTIHRALRPNNDPQVHYGTIGSANVVIKDATVRDKLQEDMDILCVEMEAAGIMNSFPSLVIRGICDYADSHKNKAWQPYAAAVAAAYMKELLLTIPVQQVSQTPYALKSTASVVAPSLGHPSEDVLDSQGKAQHGVSPVEQTAALYDALHYDGMNARAEQIGLPVLPLESFEWVWSTSLKTWLNQSTGFYWITGKPGSGKSTLMRYLVDARQTKELLSSNVAEYTVLSFFFDYRAGASTANNEFGLSKWLLIQLCDRFADVESRLKRQNMREPLKNANSSRLLDLLCSIIQDLPTRVCIFVDGLDEYTGEQADLVHLLEGIHHRTHVKICFASRPEPVFQRLFEGFPRIAMQDHNASCVRIYIDHAIARARDTLVNFDAMFDDSLREEVLNRATGVIIWARLAVDELLRALQSRPSKDHLAAILDQLPDDLEKMYDRAFARIHPEQLAEAASLLFMLNESQGKINLKIFQGIWNFLELDVSDNNITHRPVATRIFLNRVQNLFGSFIDVNTEPIPFSGGHPDRGIEIRLMHRTLQPYLNRSDTVQLHVHQHIKRHYPNKVMLRLYANVVVAATSEQSHFIKEIGSISEFQDVKSPRLSSSNVYNFLASLTTDVNWVERLDLLVQSIFGFFEMAYSDHSMDHDASNRICTPALQSPLLRLGCFRDEVVESTSSSLRRYRGCLGLQGAIRGVLPECIVSIIADYTMETIPNRILYPEVWNGLLTNSITGMYGYGTGRLDDVPSLPTTLIHSRLAKHVEVVRNMIRPFGTAVELDLLRFLFYEGTVIGPGYDGHLDWLQSDFSRYLRKEYKHSLRTGFDWIILPGYVFREHSVQSSIDVFVYKLLYSMRDLPCTKIPDSETSCNCKHGNHQLQLSMHWPGFIFSSPYAGEQLMRVKKCAMKILIGRDRSVNGQCERHGTSLHVLMGLKDQWFGWHGFECLERLLILATLGANPNLKHNDMTPLQIISRLKMKNFFQKPQYPEAIAAAIKILKHHKRHGSWPDFTQILTDDARENFMLWKTDDSGQIILDDPEDLPAPKEDGLEFVE